MAELSFEERLALLVDREVLYRESPTYSLNFTGESMRKVSANLTDRDRSV